jgi:dihydroorotase
MKIAIINGLVINPRLSDKEEEHDIVIDNGEVVDILSRGTIGSKDQFDEIIDASNCVVTPGLIDIHVHLREPGQEWKETIDSGGRCAIKGGFTRVCCMPNTVPVNDSVEVTKYIIDKADAAQGVHVHPIGAVSLKSAGKALCALQDLKEAGCVAFSDDGYPVYDALMMRRALEWARQLDVPITCHEEVLELTQGGCMNESALSYRLGLRGMPRVAEDIMIARDIELARLTGGHVHLCHVSTARAVEMVRRAKLDGISVTAEVTMHHLTLTQDRVANYDTAAKMSPPLRLEEDCIGLLEGLKDGSIDVVASDHAPHDVDSKRVEFSKAAMGIIGFPTTLPLLLGLVNEGKISLFTAIRSLTSKPAELFRLPGGVIAKGNVADITVIDPTKEFVLRTEDILSKSKNTPYLGWSLKGCARDVLVSGIVKMRDYNLTF